MVLIGSIMRLCFKIEWHRVKTVTVVVSEAQKIRENSDACPGTLTLTCFSLGSSSLNVDWEWYVPLECSTDATIWYYHLLHFWLILCDDVVSESEYNSFLPTTPWSAIDERIRSVLTTPLITFIHQRKNLQLSWWGRTRLLLLLRSSSVWLYLCCSTSSH